MDRKFKNCLTALSACGLFLVAAILAGGPVEQTRPSATPLVGTGADAGDQGTYHARTDRRGLALPYFSFARGVRRIGG